MAYVYVVFFSFSPLSSYIFQTFIRSYVTLNHFKKIIGCDSFTHSNKTKRPTDKHSMAMIC